MSELLHHLGINWKLLLAQAVNFLLLLFILRLTVYGPLLGLLRERREKIEKGMREAALAEERLREADAIKSQKVKEAEAKSLEILSATEKKSKELEAALLASARGKETDLIERAKRQAEAVTEEERRKFYTEAAGIVKEAIRKTVEASPEAIDERLIGDVVQKLKQR